MSSGNLGALYAMMEDFKGQLDELKTRVSKIERKVQGLYTPVKMSSTHRGSAKKGDRLFSPRRETLYGTYLLFFKRNILNVWYEMELILIFFAAGRIVKDFQRFRLGNRDGLKARENSQQAAAHAMRFLKYMLAGHDLSVGKTDLKFLLDIERLRK